MGALHSLSVPEVVFLRSGAWYAHAAAYVAVLHGYILCLIEADANLRLVYGDVPELHVLYRLLVRSLQYECCC